MKTRFLLSLFLFFVLCSYTSGKDRPDTLKILAIGNSFSEDGVEYLDDLAQAAGIPIVIGNMSIGGCSLERHRNNIEGNLPHYTYFKSENGVTTVYKNIALPAAIVDEEWDYISVQQVSHLSGMPNSYAPYLQRIMDYLKEHATNKHVKYAFHQTWAYAKKSSHNGFHNYNCNQETMYNAIISTVQKVTKEQKIKTVIPSGTTIQNLRVMVGDTLCRDAFHLSYGLGRYAASCAWFETLCKRSVVGNSFVPPSVSAKAARLAQEAAHKAVKKPRAVSVKQRSGRFADSN